MKKTTIDYFNIFFSGIFLLLLILYVVALFKNKEFSKVNWTVKITSLEKNSTEEKSNMIKVINAELFNTFNKSTYSKHYESRDLIYSKFSDSLYFNSEHELFPDSLSLNYFSLNENKFYIINTKIPYEKLKAGVENKNLQTVLNLRIEPKGKVSLFVEYSKNGKSFLTEQFHAKETIGKLSSLVYEKSLDKDYNEFPTLKKVTDFSDIMIKKYLWSVKIETENSERINEVSVNAFDESTIGILDEKFENPKINFIPKRVLIKWGNTQEYGSQYYFDAQKILDAFRELDETNSQEPIIFTFKVLKNAFPKCEISKAGKTIKLKNIYPELPIQYSN